jgi:hypothetical protein
LVDLDCDNQRAVDAFLRDNPWAEGTLQTRASRGRHFFSPLKGAYPQKVISILHATETETKVLPDGTTKQVLKNLGEWRGGGGQTVIAGLHESGCNYELLNDAPVMEVSLEAFNRPAEWKAVWALEPEPQSAQSRPPDMGEPWQESPGRIPAYLAGCPPAISGNGGHIQTLKVATQLVIDFALGVEGAMPYLREYNKRCEPPWSEKELLHKAQEAQKNKLGRELGAKIHREPSPVSPSEGIEGFDGKCGGEKDGHGGDWEKTGTNPSNHSGGNTQEDAVLRSPSRETGVGNLGNFPPFCQSNGLKQGKIPQFPRGVYLKRPFFRRAQFWPIIMSMRSPKARALTPTLSVRSCQLLPLC